MASLEIRIQTTDVCDVSADVLVLKYAQRFYGADAAVANRLEDAGGGPLAVHPPVGNYAVVDARGQLATAKVLFVGVRMLPYFDYEGIREFARLGLEFAAREFPTAEHIAMTVHGVSYGLDEQESFLAQVAGLYDAAPRVPGIRRVTIAECRPARARRLAAILDRLVREQSDSTADSSGSTLETPTQIEAGAASLAKAHVFVAMPFSSEFEDTYVFGIQGPVNTAGFLCERIDMAVFTGDILNRIKERIETAALVIADLTGANANVYLEVGYAWGRNRPTLLLMRKGEQMKFDVQGQRCIMYENIVDLSKKLTQDLEKFVQSQGKP